jgi:hypothetical protein
MMVGVILSVMIGVGAPSTDCLAAAYRFVGFLQVEAKGTRHEEQIAAAIRKAGGLEKRVEEIASAMDEAKCKFLLTAPDSTIRALAIATLPERNGK